MDRDARSSGGVGFSCSPGLRSLVQEVRDLVDIYEVSPDLLCQEVDEHGPARLRPDPRLIAQVEDMLDDKPILYHGLTLSIGSADGWNESYLTMLASFFAWRQPAWHSEHLGFLYFRSPEGGSMSTGIPLPVPFTAEAAALLTERITAIQARFPVPFLIENTAYYLPELPAEPGWDEAVFLDEVARRSGCGLLLDLHNLYCNAQNHGLDAEALVMRLDLAQVTEIHLAGGVVHDGFVLDVHSRLVPEPVWRLFEQVLPHARNLRAVVYEVMEQAVPWLDPADVRGELRRIRSMWRA
jgi:uncharacterized protein (UPF0276 family)